MNAIFSLAITIVLAVIGWYVLVYIAGLVGIPGDIVKITGVLLFLYVAWQIFTAVKARKP